MKELAISLDSPIHDENGYIVQGLVYSRELVVPWRNYETGDNDFHGMTPKSRDTFNLWLKTAWKPRLVDSIQMDYEAEKGNVLSFDDAFKWLVDHYCIKVGSGETPHDALIDAYASAEFSKTSLINVRNLKYREAPNDPAGKVVKMAPYLVMYDEENERYSRTMGETKMDALVQSVCPDLTDYERLVFKLINNETLLGNKQVNPVIMAYMLEHGYNEKTEPFDSNTPHRISDKESDERRSGYPVKYGFPKVMRGSWKDHKEVETFRSWTPLMDAIDQLFRKGMITARNLSKNLW